MPPTILVLGATGGTGRALLPLLLAHTDAQLILAGRDGSALERTAAAANTPGRVSSRVLDGAAPARELAPRLAGAQLVVVVAPLTHALPELVRAAAAAGADTLDIQFSPSKSAGLRALEGELVAAGRTAITDGGFHPGLPGVLARAVEDRFTLLRTARVGGIVQEDWRGVRARRETAREFVQLLADVDPAHFVDGRWLRESATSTNALASFDFGAPFGRRRCFAMGLDEMRLWAGGRRGLVRAGFYVAGFNPIVDYLLLPLVFLGRKLAPERSVALLTPLLMGGLRALGRPPFGTVLRLEAEGEWEGRPQRVVLSVAHRESYALTAMAVAATIRQWADGTLRGPGLRLQALAVEPRRFLEDLERFGATVTEPTTSPMETAAAAG